MALSSPFTASRLQVVTYLCGVALFSISFLVFLNSSISFVITDLIGQKDGVGNAVGTLGFADELVALAACPFWGIVSDRLGIRMVKELRLWVLLLADRFMLGLLPWIQYRWLVFVCVCAGQQRLPTAVTCEATLQCWGRGNVNYGNRYSPDYDVEEDARGRATR